MILQTLIDSMLNTGIGDIVSGVADAITGFLDEFAGSNCTASDNSTCPASAFNAISAAFATQGYWAQADILEYLSLSNKIEGSLGNIAPLIYVIAALMGLFGVALGAPPKLWVWFLVGPGMYMWLTETSYEGNSVDGVRVMMGKPGGAYWNENLAGLAQSKVWQLAKVGIQGMDIYERNDCSIDEKTGPSCSSSERNLGSGAVAPAYLFVVLDSYISYIIETLIDWTGVYRAIESDEIVNEGEEIAKMSPDHLVSNLKWSTLEDITAAKLNSPDLRDLFVTFLTSECGDAFSASVNPANFVAASSAKGKDLPDYIFFNGDIEKGNFYTMMQNMKDLSIPKPRSLIRMISGKSARTPGSFVEAIQNFEGEIRQSTSDDSISCMTLLKIVIVGFRWEAGHSYYQMLTDAPPGMFPARFLRNLVLGWPIQEDVYSSMGVTDRAGYEDTLDSTPIEDENLE